MRRWFVAVIVALQLQAQRYNTLLWRTNPLKGIYPLKAIEDSLNWIVTAYNPEDNKGFLGFFSKDLLVLQRAYWLTIASPLGNFHPNALLLKRDTLYIAGSALYSSTSQAVIASLTKGSLSSYPALLKAYTITSATCSSCITSLSDMIEFSDTLFAIGTIGEGSGNGQRNILLLIWDKNTDTLVAHRYKFSVGDVNDYGERITIANNGDLLICGTTYTLSNRGDIFLMRLRRDGSVVWSKLFGYKNYEFGRGILEDSAGNIYVAGYSYPGILSFPPAIVIAKYRSDGTLVWHRYFRWNYVGDRLLLREMRLHDGKLYLAVRSNSYATDDENIYLLVVDTAGTPLFVKQLIDHSHNLMGVSPIFLSVRDSLIQTLSYYNSPNNNALLGRGLIARNTSSTANLYCGEALLTIQSGQEVITDVYLSTIPQQGGITVGATNLSLQFATLTKWVLCDTCALPSPAAQFQWNNNQGKVQFTNTSQNASQWLWDFGDGDTATTQHPQHTYLQPGSYNVCLIAYNACYSDTFCQIIEIPCVATHDTIAVTACNFYIIPSGDTLFSSGFYNDSLVSYQGCDSILTILLNIATVDTSISVSADTLIANATNANYQWLQCNDTGYSIIPGATSPLFVPSSPGSYAVAIEQQGCRDTSACYTVVATLQMATSRANLLYFLPSKKVLVIKEPNSFFNFRICDLNGKIVKQGYISPQLSTIDLKDLPQGVYFIHLIFSGTVSTRRQQYIYRFLIIYD